MSEPPVTLARAREELLGLVMGLRPELHRYARLTGSVLGHSLEEPAPTPDALLAFDGGKAPTIRDYRYVPDIALEAQVEKA